MRKLILLAAIMITVFFASIGLIWLAQDAHQRSLRTEAATEAETGKDAPIETCYLVDMEITAYCPGECCCQHWADGFFADGSEVGGKAIAADTRYYPMGTVMSIPGYGIAVVKDRGGSIKGKNRLDLYFDSHQDALTYGHRYNVSVKVRNEK
jgi:3D (Asp-Asp-Asp) domain-containing protein